MPPDTSVFGPFAERFELHDATDNPFIPAPRKLFRVRVANAARTFLRHLRDFATIYGHILSFFLKRAFGVISAIVVSVRHKRV